MKFVGVDELHAAFLDESRTPGRRLVPRTGNPGQSVQVDSGFHFFSHGLHDPSGDGISSSKSTEVELSAYGQASPVTSDDPNHPP